MRNPKLPKFPQSLLFTGKPKFESNFGEGWAKLSKRYNETCVSSGMPQLSRETVRLRVLANLRESNATPQEGSRYRVALIQEGLGNLGDAHYYSAEAIESGVAVFEGKKFMIDHPSKSEDIDRPERSTRSIAGYYENLGVGQDKGRAQLEADLVILPGPSFDMARTQVEEAIKFREKFPDKHLVGLSINAAGESQPVDATEFLNSGIPEVCALKVKEAIDQGVETIRVVKQFSDAISCDLVTDPGAGGTILDIL